MVVNESLVMQLLQSFDSISIGVYVNKILFFVGGIAGATFLYFILMIYYQRKTYKEAKEANDVRLKEQLLLLEIHKLLKALVQQNNNKK